LIPFGATPYPSLLAFGFSGSAKELLPDSLPPFFSGSIPGPQGPSSLENRFPSVLSFQGAIARSLSSRVKGFFPLSTQFLLTSNLPDTPLILTNDDLSSFLDAILPVFLYLSQDPPLQSFSEIGLTSPFPPPPFPFSFSLPPRFSPALWKKMPPNRPFLPLHTECPPSDLTPNPRSIPRTTLTDTPFSSFLMPSVSF